MFQNHGTTPKPQPPKLLDQVRGVIRARHDRLRTEEASVRWMRRFILFHGTRHPREMGVREVQQFLTHLAVEGRVAASTQSQALSAILFLYHEVLKQDIGRLHEVVRQLSGTTWMMATLLYGSGLRLMECLRLRVKDIDFASHQIAVRDGKGHKDRVTMLPLNVQGPLQRHLDAVKQLHTQDRQVGRGHVYLPYALERKYPNASGEWAWQYVFPAATPAREPRTGVIRRHHVHKLVLQRAVQAAVRQAGIAKAASCHTLRHYADSRTMPSEV